MANKPKASPRSPAQAMAASDLRTKMVKEQVEKESADFDARTIKLRALRLAKEEADKAAQASAPPKAKSGRRAQSS